MPPTKTNVVIRSFLGERTGETIYIDARGQRWTDELPPLAGTGDRLARLIPETQEIRE